MDLTGTWVITHHWPKTSYKFKADFTKGRITVGDFYGTYQEQGKSNNLALAITADDGSSITAYIGEYFGPTMGGQMTGVTQKGAPVSGTWSAQRQKDHDLEMKALAAPGE